MDKLSIGFIGGCINKQPGIEKDRNYISILKNLLAGEYRNISTHTASYLSYDQLAEKAISFIAGKRPNIVCVFIRPFPLLPLHKLSIKYNTANNETGWTLHPGLFKKGMQWPSKLTENQVERPFVYTPKARISLRDMNILAGMPLMLHRWAMKYLDNIFSEIQVACKKTDTQFVLISPPKSPGYVMGDLVCKRTTYYFRQYCLINGINYVNINVLPKTCFEKDKIHANEYGHQRIAKLLHEQIHNMPVYRKWLSSEQLV